MKYLLDTGTLAAALRGRLPVVLRLSQLKPGDLAVSAVSRMEAESALRAQPRLLARHGRLLREFFGAVRTLDFGAREAQQAAAVAAAAGAAAQPLSGFDLMLAATALTHQLTLVTERASAFDGVPGLDVESWR